MAEPCKHDEFIGRAKEFMSHMDSFVQNLNGLKTTLFTVALAILIQVGTFLYLWGGLTTTVNYHTKSIDAMLHKMGAITGSDDVNAVISHTARSQANSRGPERA